MPLFFMISGGLILPKIANCNIMDFYKRRVPQFIIFLVFWSVLTNSLKLSLDGEGLVKSIITAAIKYNGIYPGSYGSASQLWFLYSITQLYLIAPFLARMLERLTNNGITLFIIFCFLFNQFKNTAAAIRGDWSSLQRMGSDFTVPYLIFFVIGYLIIERNVLYKKTALHLFYYLCTAFIPVLVLVAFDYYSGKVSNGLHWYSWSVFILISSIGLLLAMRWIFESKKSNKIISIISHCSFGIYLSHYIFIYISIYLVNFYECRLGSIQLTLAYFSLSFLMGLFLTFIFMKFRYTKKLLS
nr:acyltransferase [Pantoea sp. RIT 413]